MKFVYILITENYFSIFNTNFIKMVSFFWETIFIKFINILTIKNINKIYKKNF